MNYILLKLTCLHIQYIKQQQQQQQQQHQEQQQRQHISNKNNNIDKRVSNIFTLQWFDSFQGQ